VSTWCDLISFLRLQAELDQAADGFGTGCTRLLPPISYFAYAHTAMVGLFGINVACLSDAGQVRAKLMAGAPSANH
jgi:hypothetical protein